MFHAQAAAHRSAALSRQLGAAITTKGGSLISVGTNDVPKAGGGLYWEGDEHDKRDHILGIDSSDVVRRGMLAEVLDRLITADWIRDEQKARLVSVDECCGPCRDWPTDCIRDRRTSDRRSLGVFEADDRQMASTAQVRRRGFEMTRAVSACLLVACVIAPRVAGAQSTTSHFDVGVSEGFINAIGLYGGNNYHQGWVLSGALYPASWWGLAADIGAGFNDFGNPPGEPGPPLRASFFNFMAGPRLVVRSIPHLRPFAQAVFGGVRFGNNYGGYQSRFAWQTGGGLDLALSRRLAVRLQTDWRFIPVPPPPAAATFKQWRLAAGIVFN